MTKKSNLFYWFYIGYAHRSILSKYVFPLHVLNENENGINKSHNGTYYDLLVSIICTGLSENRKI